jgi:hypothetical protein
MFCCLPLPRECRGNTRDIFISCYSKQAIFDGKKAIRGGIPFVFRKYLYLYGKKAVCGHMFLTVM